MYSEEFIKGAQSLHYCPEDIIQDYDTKRSTDITFLDTVNWLIFQPSIHTRNEDFSRAPWELVDSMWYINQNKSIWLQSIKHIPREEKNEWYIYSLTWSQEGRTNE